RDGGDGGEDIVASDVEFFEFADGTFLPSQLLNQAPVLDPAGTPADVVEITGLDEGTGSAWSFDVGDLLSDPNGTVDTPLASTGTFDTHTFSLVNDAGGRFAIDETTGLVTVADPSLLDFETNTSHSITVVVEDADGLTGFATYEITVADRNEPLIVQDDTETTAEDGAATFDVLANDDDEDDTPALTGVTVTAVATTSASFAAPDLATAQGLFSIDGGEIAFDPLGVFDGLRDGETATITVSYDVTSGPDSETGTLTVTITGETDAANSLLFNDGTPASIQENTENGFVIGQTTSEDPNPDPEDPIVYALIDDANGRFVIDAETGEVSVADGQKLDFERATEHEIIISATNSGGEVTQTVTISVGDVLGETVIRDDRSGTTEGGNEVDTLVGGNGDDRLIGNGGDDELSGGGGSDDVRGGDGRDNVTGGGGNDMLRGNADNDVLRGNDGNDSLFGGGDDDDLRGGDGNDTLDGGDGSDELRGNDGRDDITGGDGNDTLRGGEGGDTLRGNEGNDELFGNDGADELRGGSGNDRLNGNNGSDQLFGGSGDDRLFGGDGQDTMTGDAGEDRFIFETQGESGRGDDADQILDFDRSDDLIDLRDLVEGRFEFIGSSSFDNGSSNQVRVVDIDGGVRVRIDYDGDTTSEMDIDVLGVGNLNQNDFLL
ncbi:MAG: cadherin domain-containing protein, partial [Pseudomonadota bacterium]